MQRLADERMADRHFQQPRHRARQHVPADPRGACEAEHPRPPVADQHVSDVGVRWQHLQAARRQDPDQLTFDPAMLTHDSAEEVSEADYPEQWSVTGGLTFGIDYHFEPGAPDDGITIEVPVATLNRVTDDDFSWLVPGLREEVVIELIRSLPKQLRVNFVPAPNKAREFLAAVPAGEEPLLTALSRYLRSTTGVHVPSRQCVANNPRAVKKVTGSAAVPVAAISTMYDFGSISAVTSSGRVQ